MISIFCFLAFNLITSDAFLVSPFFGLSPSRYNSNPRIIQHKFVSSFHQNPNFKKRKALSDITNVYCANQYPDDDLVFSEVYDEADEDLATQGNTTRHPIYWIDEVEPHRNTRSLAAKNAKNIFKFLKNKSPAPYNVQAFEQAKAAYDRYCHQVAVNHFDTTSHHLPN